MIDLEVFSHLVELLEDVSWCGFLILGIIHIIPPSVIPPMGFFNVLRMTPPSVSCRVFALRHFRSIVMNINSFTLEPSSQRPFLGK